MPTLKDYEKNYDDMIGFTPERIRKRLASSIEIDPDTLDIVEAWRMNALTPDSLEPKTVQLIAFAILLVQTSGAAINHAHAAVKCGATREELHAAASIATLFRGIAAFNHAGEIIDSVFDSAQSE